ncbi:MAG TPA: malto-oligosyltrehalose trehalohydrolase, partial [Egibacteraceae bacterium]|nr:malto-oligosyltrehalose trehalohydrolase [Egibacteraceae bacterium]
MTAFRVWAPWADRIELVLADRHAAMAREDRGWFAATLEAHAGDDYGFSLDGDPPRPDPASRWQPLGVHEPSRLLDPAALRASAAPPWRPPPLERAVFYELHVGTFTPEGTLASAAEQIAELAELGVTHVELMPIAAFSGDRGWGYDGVCWSAVHEPYGGPEGLVTFVQACHRAGVAVILDVVYNHLGPSGNYLPEFGPYLTDRYSTPWGEAINLDGPGSDEVRGLIVGSALAWLEDYGIDGLRLDAVHAMFDYSARHILAELSQAVDALAVELGRPLALIAESDRNDPTTIRPRHERGLGVHAQWSDDLHHAIHTAVTGEHDGYYADYAGLEDVAAAYRDGFVYAGRYSVARERTVGAPLTDDVGGHRLVSSLQNHDQVGNRARGERLTSLAPPALVRACAVLLCAAPHAPLLFMGEEFGAQTPFLYFAGHIEDDLADAVTAGRREEFADFSSFTAEIPDPQAESTFLDSRLDWGEAATR